VPYGQCRLEIPIQIVLSKFAAYPLQTKWLTGFRKVLYRTLVSGNLRRFLEGKAEIIGSLTQFREAVMPIWNAASKHDVAFYDLFGRLQG